MTTRVMKAALAALVAAFVLTATMGSADAFWGHRRGVTTAYALPTVPVTASMPVVAAYAPAPVVVSRPIVYASPIVSAPVVTANYAPIVTANYAPMAAPVTTYYAPAPIMAAAPTTTFYAPAPTYVAPTTTFYAPAPVVVHRPWLWP